jgi:hypothetical protein
VRQFNDPQEEGMGIFMEELVAGIRRRDPRLPCLRAVDGDREDFASDEALASVREMLADV